MKCPRCQGRKEIPNYNHDGSQTIVMCPVCLGLGAYEEDRQEQEPEQHFFIALHSNTLKLEDILDLLPQKGTP